MSDLRKLAEAATCREEPDNLICLAHNEVLFDGRCEDGWAEVDPPILLALLDENERLRAALERIWDSPLTIQAADKNREIAKDALNVDDR